MSHQARLEAVSILATLIYPNSSASILSFNPVGAGGDDQASLFFSTAYGSSALRMVITAQGNVAIGGFTGPTHLLHVGGVARSTSSTWATTSDVRVKENIQSLNNGSLDKIMQLNPVTYNWKKDYFENTKGLKENNTGFVSQELEQVFPEMIDVVEEKFGEQTISDFRLLNLSDLPVHLVKAIQEQQELIEQMRKEIDELKKNQR